MSLKVLEKQDLAATVEKDFTHTEDMQALEVQADTLVDLLLAIEPRDLAEQTRQARALSNIGENVQLEMMRKNQLLKSPISKLVEGAEDGGPVANALLSLQEQVNEINPNQVNFDGSGVRRLLGKLPFVGTPVARWFAKYQAVDTVISDIVASLKDGQRQLENDNIILSDEQNAMRVLTFQLQDFVKLAQIIDNRLDVKLQELQQEDDRRSFLEQEVQFPVRQRIIDLQQQLAVNQQGVLTTEVIIRNNRELIRGVSRSVNVTVTALNVAATLAVALQTQKKVLHGVQAVNRTTDDLLTQTAEQLKTQGVEIQKEAASAQLDVAKLKQAFADVNQALEDISSFRREALPKMASTIVEMDELTGQMEKSISKMEQGNVQKSLVIDLNQSA